MLIERLWIYDQVPVCTFVDRKMADRCLYLPIIQQLLLHRPKAYARCVCLVQTLICNGLTDAMCLSGPYTDMHCIDGDLVLPHQSLLGVLNWSIMSSTFLFGCFFQKQFLKHVFVKFVWLAVFMSFLEVCGKKLVF